MQKDSRILSLLMLSLLFFISTGSAAAGGLEIEIKGIESMHGSLMLAVYDNAENFLNVEKAVIKENIVITSDIIRHEISDLSPGTYAIAVFHDTNLNNVLDKGIFGKPAEPYGLSNNRRGVFGPPKFKDCAFEFRSPEQKVSITLQ